MSRAMLITADLSVLLFGLTLLVGGLPAMIFGAPYAQTIGGTNFAYLWMFTCLLAQCVGCGCAIVASMNLEKR